MVRKFLSFFFVFGLISQFVYGQHNELKVMSKEINPDEQIGESNLAFKWGRLALVATANDTERFKPRPTVTSRYLGLIFISIFDAWSRYDEKVVPVHLSNVNRRSLDEQTTRKKEIAIS